MKQVRKDIYTKGLVSIIIRSKNEEKWISQTLRSVFLQNYKNFEVILVDNSSKDKTVPKAKLFPIKVISIDQFLPGKAINEGIDASNGEFIVILSAHCIPTNQNWLENIIKPLAEENIAGVYGRQQPLPYSSDLDKRDLITIFGLDRKIQIKDSYFHNANSALRRSFWEMYKFDESVTNIEDRVWGSRVIKDGYKIIYEPTASVFHYHGVNQDLNKSRAKNIVKILENLDDFSKNKNYVNKQIENMRNIAIIPIKGKSLMFNEKYLLEYTLDNIINSKFVKYIVVSSDEPENKKITDKYKNVIFYQRPNTLSFDYVDIAQVVTNTLDNLELKIGFADLVVVLEEVYPFREKELIDKMIKEIVDKGLDTLLAGKPENRGLIIKENDQLEIFNEGFMPSKFKDKETIIGLYGLCLISHPECFRENSIFSKKFGYFPIENNISTLIINEKNLGNNQFDILLNNWIFN